MIAAAASIIAVVVAYYGFNVVAEFATICTPWLMVMFTAGGMVLIPSLNETLTGYTTLSGFSDFVSLAGTTVLTGINAEGKPGIGLMEVIGFAWAANTFAHFGLVDMALLRYAKKSVHGLCTATGMMFGHYIAWISAALMGAATASLMQLSIAVVSPGDVAYYALGATGFVIVIIAGWTTANPNLYRAGLAAQAVFPSIPRQKVTLAVGAVVVVGAPSRSSIAKSADSRLRGTRPRADRRHRLRRAAHLPAARLQDQLAPPEGRQGQQACADDLGDLPGVRFRARRHRHHALRHCSLPTWAVAIVSYTLLAKAAGADKSHPEAEQREQEFDRRVRSTMPGWRPRKTRRPSRTPRSSPKGIRAVWILIGLVVPAVLAWRVLFNSPDLYSTT